MGNEKVDAFVSTQHGNVGLPFPTVAEQIGREPAVRCQQALNVRVNKFWWWHGFTGGGSCSIPLLRRRRFKGWLDKTFMGRNGDVIVATVALLPPTSVRVFSINHVHGTTVQTFFCFSTRLAGSMERQALGAVKGQVALVADDGGLLVHVVVWAWSGLVSIAGSASGTLARVVGCIIVVIATVTLVAPIALVDEPSDGGTPLKVLVAFEKDDFSVCVRSAKYQKKGMVTAENLHLVRRVQGRQVGLELL